MRTAGTIGAVVALAAMGCGGGSSHASAEPTDAATAHEETGSGPADAAVAQEASVVVHASVCNGHAELCSRRYDQVAFPGTHGSYSASSEGFLAPDQTYGIAQQLAAGVRVLHFEVHVYQGGIYACHSLCEFGSKLFADEMQSVDTFLLANPDEVVTLLLERSDDVITADDIGGAMMASGLASLTHVQAVGAAWPTLGEMIDSGQRLVALLDDTTGSSSSWLLPRWQLTWETPWDNETPADFGQCDVSRGTMSDGVYVVDTYLEDQDIDTSAHSALVNYDPFLVTRLLYCQRATATLPNFVMINFYDVSDLFTVVDVLNGFAPTPSVDLNAFPPSAWPSDGGVESGVRDGGAPVDASSPRDAAVDEGDGAPADAGSRG